MKGVLYLSYTGLLEPLGQSQVLAYLRELTAGHGYRFQVISYEKPQHWADRKSMHQQQVQISRAGIGWHPLPYHQRPTLPATMYDVLRGLPRAIRLVQRYRIEIVHVRSYVPMLIGLALKKLLGTRLIFDMRGLWADERADLGQCSRRSAQYQAIKALESAGLRAADHIVTLTERARHELMKQPPLAQSSRPLTVIPCCADLERFQRDQQARAELRRRHGWTDKTVIVVSGSLGGWYMTDELATLYSTWLQLEGSLHLLVLTHSDPTLMTRPLQAQGVNSANYTVRAAATDQMPAWLSAADVAVSLIRPFYSKIASSPTKQAEYLGCGLPIVANSGIGDSDALISNNAVGAVFEGWEAATYRSLWPRLQDLLNDTGLQARCRSVAEQHLSLTKGAWSYGRIYAGLETRGTR